MFFLWGDKQFYKLYIRQIFYNRLKGAFDWKTLALIQVRGLLFQMTLFGP